jgi:hypothetical protein
LEFLARVLIHIPETKKHLVHFYGAYANRIRSNYRSETTAPLDEATNGISPRSTLTKRWAELVYRVYEVDPLTCTQCGGEMKIRAFITDDATIQKILNHRNKNSDESRAPPPISSD